MSPSNNGHQEQSRIIQLFPEKHADRHPDPGSFWAVIPAGGSGTRLWPVSRSRMPKFLISFIGDARSLLQQTVDRLRFAAAPERMLIVCGPAHADSIATQVRELAANQMLVEPAPRGTCPAIALAAAIIERRDPGAIMGSFAADHAVTDQASFERSIRLAIDAAERGFLVTIGCRPNRPETGYGYINVSEHEVIANERGTVYKVSSFVEKPDLPTAISYLQSGHFLWNAGMFVWKASAFLEELLRHEPVIADGVRRIAAAWGTADQQRVLDEIWPTLPDISVDNGVMERSDRVAVVPAEFGWSDVGDWHGLSTLLDHDESGNCTRGDTINIGSINSMVWSDTQRVISIIGLEDVVVVDTPDALLVANRAHAQLVRSTVSKLKERNRPDLY